MSFAPISFSGTSAADEQVPVQQDLPRFLHNAGVRGQALEYPAGRVVFWQGSPADGVFCIRGGRVKLSVLSSDGKEAVIALLGEGDFLGEQGIAGFRQTWMTTAVALTDCQLLKLSSTEMSMVLRREPAFLQLFLSFLLASSQRMQAALADHFFNSSEKRLARILLLLADFRKPGETEKDAPRLSHESLAAMVGTTRARISFFMNQFRKRGMIDYHAANPATFRIRRTLLGLLVHPEDCGSCPRHEADSSSCVRCPHTLMGETGPADIT
jgi:CRP/FNR family cyclic AMP-dependent transcriptional regulator